MLERRIGGAGFGKYVAIPIKHTGTDDGYRTGLANSAPRILRRENKKAAPRPLFVIATIENAV
jgi:hypothetical protein